MKLTLRKDPDSQMVEVVVNGDVVMSGNYWDFEFMDDLPDVLGHLGIEVLQERYQYKD